MNYVFGLPGCLIEPQEGGQYLFNFQERKNLYGVFRSRLPVQLPQEHYDVLLLEAVDLVEDENLIDLQAPVLLNLPELRPTGEILHFQYKNDNNIVLIKQIYVTFTSKFVANIIRFNDGMQGVYHISDEHTEHLRDLATGPMKIQWEVSFIGFFNHHFSVILGQQGRNIASTDGKLFRFINSEHEFHNFKVDMHEVSSTVKKFKYSL